MSFSGTVDRESHEGGLLVSFEGRAPRLGATLRIIGGKPIGKVNSVIGAIDGAFVHIHPITDQIEVTNTIGSPVEIAPREKREYRGRGRDSYSKGNSRRDDRRGGNNDKKGGDWNCPKCNNSNFAFRKKCNRCEADRPRDGGRTFERKFERGGNNKQKGQDWTCPKCNNSNFAFRNKCNRCEADRPRDGGRKFERKFERSGNNKQKGQDWTCPKCNNSNFAFRDKCNRCEADRPSSGGKTFSRGGGNERRGSRPQGGHPGRGRGRSPGSASKPRRSGFRGTGRGGPRGNRPGRGSGRR